MTMKRKRRDTITRKELGRLSFCNSRRMPTVVNDGGIRKRWVGIGWVAEGPANGHEVKVVEGKP
jgi:hypothetical protein